MSIILSAFLGRYVTKLSEFVEGEIALLWGVKGDLHKLIQTLNTLSTFLEEAENLNIEERPRVKLWLNKFRDFMYDADDIADRCTIERGKHTLLLEHRLLDCRPTNFRSTLVFGLWLGRRIKKLNNQLDNINKERRDFHLNATSLNNSSNQQGTAPVDVETQLSPDTVGLEDDTTSLVEILDEERWYDNNKRFTVFGILGTAGIGKTTLALMVFNHPRIKGRYQLRIWLRVSENYSVRKLLKEMIRWSGGDHGQCKSKTELEALLIPLLSGKRVLLVLDNVWNDKVWVDGLRSVLESSEAIPDSGVLVTSRHEFVSMGMNAVHSHRMKNLSEADGWALLCKKLELQEEDIIAADLKEIGMELVNKCHRLPLAIKAVAGVLNMKPKLNSEWRTVLSSPWFTDGVLPDEVMKLLYLSYQDLPSHIKECFLYFSLFPDGFSYLRRDLARLWVAEGYMKIQPGFRLREEHAEECYEQLIQRNILQPDPLSNDGESRCTIHDLFKELAVTLAGGESCFKSTTTDMPNYLQGATPKLRRLTLQSPDTDVLVLPVGVREPKCLRSLMLDNALQTKAIDRNLFRKLKNLRVLDLSMSSIESLPNAIHHLIHLRLLDLRRTKIKDLPDSIGRLCSLQTLDLSYCEYLSSLPPSMTMLRNLRCLRLKGTAVNHLPSGIGNLGDINHFDGFMVGEQQQLKHKVCGLEELAKLTRLRFLHICKLERATEGVDVLANMPHLTCLLLDCTPSQAIPTVEEMTKIERTFDHLSPPSCLESLTINDFFGRQSPCWMAKLSTAFPRLTKLEVYACTGWQKFPQLGRLRNLRSLTIEGASSIVSIGQEFLGFPVLEILKMIEMPNWEEWSSIGTEWMPRLKQLELKKCPKLKALPRGLPHAKVLKEVHIESADQLSSIQDLPALSLQSLKLMDNKNLRNISEIQALKELTICDCKSLEYVINLHGLLRLHLIDHSLLELPPWLGGLIHLREFRLECQENLLQKCVRGAKYWQQLMQIPMVSVVTNYGYVYYTMTPSTYKTNLD